MVRKRDDIKEQLTKNENFLTTEDQSEAENQGNARKDSKGKESTNTKEYRKKKKDALQGKERKVAKDSQDENQKGRRKTGENEKEGTGGKKGGKGSGGQSTQGLQSGQTTVQFSSGGGAGLGSLLALFASSASLAKGEVGSAFNTSNVTTNLLLRTNLQSNTNLSGSFLTDEGRNLRSILTNSGDQASEGLKNKFNIETGSSSSSNSSLIGQDALSALLRNISVTANVATENQSTAPSVLNFALGGTLTIQTFNSSGVFFNEATQFTFANQGTPYGRDIVIDKYVTDAGLSTTSKYTYQVVSPTPVSTINFYDNKINTGNAYNEFSATHTPGALSINLTRPESQQDASENTGITLTPEGDLLVNALTPTSILVNVIPSGLSNTEGLLVRINAGPGPLVTAANISSYGSVSAPPSNPIEISYTETPYGYSGGLYTDGTNTYSTSNQVYLVNRTYSTYTSGSIASNIPNLMVGTIDTLNQNMLVSTVFRSAAANIIVGNAQSLLIGSSGTSMSVNYVVAQSSLNVYSEQYTHTVTTTSLNNVPVSVVDTTNYPINTTLISSTPYSVDYQAYTIPINGNTFVYELPSNTIFRHVGSSLEGGPSPIPVAPTYGNFSGIIDSSGFATSFTSIILPESPHSFFLTLGGNVLDVYGTKYGVGDGLNVTLPSGAVTEPNTNVINMGANTVAGFGLGYGDLQKLNIIGSQSLTPDTIAETFINFRSNILYVDKNVDSILYPHLQTLDLTLDPAGIDQTQLNNINILFQNSIVHGNAGDDTFYGDIQNLGDLHDPTLYSGFINQVNVEINQGIYVPGHTVQEVIPEQIIPEVVQVSHEDPQTGETIIDVVGVPEQIIPEHTVTHVVEGGFVSEGPNDPRFTITTSAPGLYGAENSIIWGNNIYTGGHELTQGAESSIDTYHFTILGDTIGRPVMTGNAIITDFNPSTDILDLQLTPAAFRALDTNHDKQITAEDLDSSGLVDIQGNQPIYDPNTLNLLGLGSVLNFSGGGSISLLESNFTSFQSFVAGNQNSERPNLLFEVNLTYLPISVPITPIVEPIINGQILQNVINGNTHYNALDQFFDNSFFATYAMTSSVPFESGLTIDSYGTITVENTKPFFTNLTIDATLAPSDQDFSSTPQTTTTASQTILMGFFDAPVTYVDANSTLWDLGNSSNTRNIFIGDVGSTIIGEKDENLNITAFGGDTIINGTSSYGSNLIVDVKGNATAYGDYQSIAFRAYGGPTGSNPSNSDLRSDHPAIFGADGNGNTYNFLSNAFNVIGTTYGIAKQLVIDVSGGSGIHVPINNNNNSLSIDNSGHFDYNHLNFLSQQLLGNGLLIGDFQDLELTVKGGTDSGFTKLDKVKNASASLDVSGSMVGNEFN